MMRWIVVAFAAVLWCGAAAHVQSADSSAELKQVQDRWLVAHRYYTPSGITDSLGKLLTNLGEQVEIKDGMLSSRDPGKEDVYLLVDFNPSGDPKTVDMRVPDNEDAVLLGIYKLEDDILSLVVGTGNRPTNFTNSETQVMLVLKRAAKKAPPSDGSDSP